MIRLTDAKSDSSRIQSLIAIADFYISEDINTDRAVSYYNQALQLANKNEFHFQESTALLRLSRLYHTTNYDIAQEYLIQAYDIAEEHQLQSLIPNIYTQFGLIKMYLEENTKARDYFLKANRYYSENNDTIGIAANLHNLGILLIADNKLDSALNFFTEAIALNKKKRQLHFLARNYRGLAEIHLKKGDQIASEVAYQNGLKISTDIKDYAFLQSLYHWKAHTFLSNKETDSAIHYANKIIALNETEILSHGERDALEIFQLAYAEKGNYRKAYTYSQELQKFRDSISVFQHSREIDMLELKLNAETEFRINELNYKNQNLRMTILLIILGFALLTVLLFLYYMYQRIRKRQKENVLIKKDRDKLELELKQKNRELTSKVMNLIEINNTMDSIISKLDDNNTPLVKDNPDFFNNLSRDIKKQRNNNIWDAFEKEFTMVHPDFMKLLLKKHPDLTIKERRLCTLLRMHLSTKEISQILNLEVRSVEMARTRLRKKVEYKRNRHLSKLIYLFHRLGTNP